MSPENKEAEFLRLEFDREKWQAEAKMRERELTLKEREQANKDTDLAFRRAEQARSRWINPLVVAILAAAVAALGNAFVAFVNGSSQSGLEQFKAESTRILEMIKTGDPERAASNLEFLLQSGLISDQTLSSNIKAFLDKRQPGTGPALPAPTRFSFEQTEALTPSVQNELQKNLESYIAYLDTIGFPSNIRLTLPIVDFSEYLYEPLACAA